MMEGIGECVKLSVMNVIRFILVKLTIKKKRFMTH